MSLRDQFHHGSW